MSTPATTPKTIHVLATFPVLVNAGELVLPVRTAAGIVQLIAPATLWAALGAAVDAALHPSPVGDRHARRISASSRPRRISPLRLAELEAAYDRWVVRSVKATEIATQLGLSSGSISTHFARIRNERAAATGRALVVKPCGQL